MRSFIAACHDKAHCKAHQIKCGINRLVSEMKCQSIKPVADGKWILTGYAVQDPDNIPKVL
jgi:hypothetical protein